MSAPQRTALARAQTTRERILFRGHPMVRSLHPTTIEITTEEHLTENGDCVIGVGAGMGCAQLSGPLKAALRREGSAVTIRVSVGTETFELTAQGDPGLELTHPQDIVIRKSRFLSGRTLAVGASAAAKDIPRSIVARLRNTGMVGALEIEVTGV